MTNILSNEQSALHARAVDLCGSYLRLEWPIVEVLQKIDRTKTHRALGAASLFQYAVQFLGLSEAVAYNFISVARKAAQIPALREAVTDGSLSVYKAGRIAPALDLSPRDEATACDLIAFAKNHTTREIEFELARRNPKRTARESVKALSGDQVEVKTIMSWAEFEMLQRAREVAAQESGKHCNTSGAVTTAIKYYVQRKDPVQKAKRAMEKLKTTKVALLPEANSPDQLRAHRIQPKMNREKTEAAKPNHQIRVSLNANDKHQVHARDGGRCTFRDAKGNRCTNERWLHIHHIKPVSEGGGNNPENLTTLCAAHHDLTHQMAFPLEGQVTWLRSPVAIYGYAPKVCGSVPR